MPSVPRAEGAHYAAAMGDGTVESGSLTASTGQGPSTCWASWRTARWPPSSGWPRTPGRRRRWPTRCTARRWPRVQIDHFDAGPRPARRAGRRRDGGDAAVPRAVQRLPRPHQAQGLAARAWSGPTSATGSPPTSTARSPPSSTPTPARWCTRCWPTRARRRSSIEQVRAAIAADREAGRPARAVGSPPGRRGAQPGAAGRRRPGRPDQPAHRHRRPARHGPGRHQPDVHPPGREPHPPDGPPRPAGLTVAASA